MLGIILSVGLCLMVLERLIPDQALQKVDGWWLRVIIVNVLQLGVVLLADLAWNQWFGFHLMNLPGYFSPPAAAFLTYLILTFVFYSYTS